jgi:aryl-alcohol dehydrogenase-like predicted oxidoreductase
LLSSATRKSIIVTFMHSRLTRIWITSPIAKGLLTGTVKKVEDIPEGDHRRNFTRFKPENLEHNLAIVDALQKVAAAKSVTAPQLCIAWVNSLGSHVIPLPGSSCVSPLYTLSHSLNDTCLFALF